MEQLEKLTEIAKNTDNEGFKKAIEEKTKALESDKTVKK